MNILVIDDEPLIHISVEKLICANLNEAQVFHAYNGNEMLQLLNEHEFLLAYVDIKMPGISGLEAIEKAKEISPMTRYYIMSGFDEFEYAKQAIKLKVDDYLLKPLDAKTIQETLQVAVYLDRINKRERKTIFRNWLESTLNHREGSLEKYDNYYCSLILITVDTPDFSKETLMIKLQPYNEFFVSTFVNNQFILLCFAENSSVLKSMRQNLSIQSYGDGITFFTSSIVKNTEALTSSLNQLLQYCSLRILLGIEKFYFLKPLLQYDSELLNFCQEGIKWQDAYFKKNYNDFVNQCDFLFRQLEIHKTLEKYKDNFYCFISYTLDINPPTDYSLTQLKDFLHEYAVTSLLKSVSNKNQIHSIIQYIQEHYCENISASSLSEHFNLSANYISNLLKQELGMRYNDYITKLRLNHAKNLLLSTNHSVKDITNACGYYSQSHFTKLFIEHMHCTPIEYRKNNTSESK